MSARAEALSQPAASPWISNPRWDLIVLSFSAVLVAVPPLVHSLGKTTAGGVDLLITLLVGGPHMYATFLKTVFEPNFRKLHPALTFAPVVIIPMIVISGALFAFQALLTFFFTWASMHVCDQASYIAYLYREKGGAAKPWQRGLDVSVILFSLYSYAMYRHVNGTFKIGDTTLWFPEFLKHAWFADAFALVTAGLIATWIVYTLNQLRRKEVGGPYVFFMALTVGVALVIPRMPELSVSFQGFNAWHSFQYLGLTFLALRKRESGGEVTLGFVRALSRPGQFLKFYGWNVLLTLGAGVIVGVLVYGLSLPPEQCYYTVTLSFLLVHYFHDHILFSDSTEAVLAEA